MKKWLILLAVLVIAALLLFPALFYSGTLRFNYPEFSEYPIQGIDVSHHQGEMDWNAIPSTQVQFAFIKATEGGDHKDQRFEENWVAAKKVGIIPGGYHFFTFCKTGTEQAANITQTIPKEAGALPPAIDLEYGGNCSERPSKMEFISELRTLSDSILSFYGVRPILYSTPSFYEEYLEGELHDHIYWARNIYGKPEPSDTRPWQFWQFTNKGEVAGISGPVDLNVFNGDRAALEGILQQ